MINITNQKIYLGLTAVILIRVISIYLFADERIENEWGVMLYNLEHHQILSIRSIDGYLAPNLFMPPLYPLFLFLIKSSINNPQFFLNVIFFIQLLLSVVSVILIYKILLQLFSKKLSLVGTTIYAFFPLNVYAVSQTSSVVLQIFLLNIFIYSFIKLFKKDELFHFFIFSLSSALLILLRGEFFLFVMLTQIYIFINNKKLSKLILTSLLIILLISPYLYRNYKIFGEITITKSLGFNLLKGNNPKSKVEGVPLFGEETLILPEIKKEITNLNNSDDLKKYDLLVDKIYFNQAINYIKENPSRYILLYVKKFLSFLMIDFNSSYQNYYSLLNILPKIIISVLSLVCIVLTFNFKINIMNYFILFYISNIGLFSFFFILPRYSLILLPIQLILSLEGIRLIKRKFFN